MTTRDDAGRNVDQAEDALLDAMRSSDVDALRSLLSDELSFALPDGSMTGKEADLEAHASHATIFESIIELRRSTSEHAGRARTTSLVEIQVVDRGQHVQATVTYDRFWVIADGRWQVVAGSATPTPSIS